jgi:hypothetical protein
MNGKVLWRASGAGSRLVCEVSGECAGVELRVSGDEARSRREQHPDFSTAYERARQILLEIEAAGYTVER